MESQNAKNKSNYFSTDSRVQSIECPAAFAQLSESERAYAYYFTRASWEGCKLCYFQRSYEAPAFFYMMQKIFNRQTVAEVKTLVTDKLNFTADEWKQLVAYVAGFFQNCGNYRSFGDTKFIPELPQARFLEFIRVTEAYNDEPSRFEEILDSILLEIYACDAPYHEIAFSDKNGASAYYSYNITEKDAEFVKEFLQNVDISPLTTRVIKLNASHYRVVLCSKKTGMKKYDYKDVRFDIVHGGEFATVMTQVVSRLEQCLTHVSNQTQYEMIQKYIEHFNTGDVNAHKDSQRAWIKDKNPVIETNIGFIEVYLDPAKVRGEFEGFVAAVDKEATKKLGDLVAHAEHLISNLTWPKEFEIDRFSKPDFTSLEVITFASSGTPIGINLPNYDDISKNEGFKNVNLGNAYGKPKKEYVQYVKPEDVDLYIKYHNDSLFLIVALHELLGHGTGKLFVKDKEGNFNFDKTKIKHPLTNEDIQSWYEYNETWGSKFGELASGYEECRADAVALFLGCFEESMKVLFPGRESEWDDILYIGWLEVILGGVRGLEYYITESKKWGQAHILASYALLQVAREAGQGFFKIEETEKDGKPYIYVSLDKSQIKDVGKKAVGQFLKELQVHKTLGDVKSGAAFFGRYSAVDEDFLRYREIVMQNKLPRRVELIHDISKNSNGEIEYKMFEESFEGIIESHIYHYQNNVDDVFDEWYKSKYHFRIRPKTVATKEK